jgi:hypothetical protein
MFHKLHRLLSQHGATTFWTKVFENSASRDAYAYRWCVSDSGFFSQVIHAVASSTFRCWRAYFSRKRRATTKVEAAAIGVLDLLGRYDPF